MCHKETLRHTLRLFALVLALAHFVAAQTGTQWRKVGSTAAEFLLASPATGPVDRVWFNSDGGLLYARTRSGKVLQTPDFETWTPAASAAEPAEPLLGLPVRIPEPGARVVTVPGSGLFSLGRQLMRSVDDGRTWVNLTGFKSESVIGSMQHSVAVSPVNPDQLVVANDFGVWRSMDGGMSWAGLNHSLPNLPVRRIVSTPAGTAGTRVESDALGTLELPPGGSVWVPVTSSRAENEAARLQQFSAKLGARVASYGQSDATIYAGSPDGRIWVSIDNGATFRGTVTDATGPVERIFVDPTRPQTALAAVGGPVGPHVLRTTNGGIFWDALDANLPNAPAHAVVGERVSGAVFVATDRGVFAGRVDLDNASSPAVNWTSLSDRLPAAPATDVKLDPAGIQLYAALDGYGVYATLAPHRMRSLRVVNAADFSLRPAAPGSLLSVIGGRVSSATAGTLNFPVLAAADDASQIQVPFDAVGPTVVLALQTPGGRVPVGLQLQAVSPAIFVSLDGSPLLQDAESGLLLDARNAARSNTHVQIFAAGLGKVRADWHAGLPAPLENPPEVAAAVRAYLNGAAIPVTRATLAPGHIGFYLVEVQLPAIVNAGVSELYISADGVESNRVQVVIEP
ncbi:MAG TPA: hypothetical protein VNY05_11785 [Candidatus Acidoferrales bacterium]|nr:hypothetical protein [Candidatus Acidoferrales bacterium]